MDTVICLAVAIVVMSVVIIALTLAVVLMAMCIPFLFWKVAKQEKQLDDVDGTLADHLSVFYPKEQVNEKR